MTEWRLAWRNVWRNPRRTALTVAATIFAAFLTIVMVALARGSHSKMIEDSVRLASGHVMVAAPGYLEDRSLDHSMLLDPVLARRLDETSDVEAWAPRVTSFGLISENVTSQGAGLLGVEPAKERSVTTLFSRISKGRFLSAEGNAREILLGEKLAEQIDAEIGDDVLVYGVAYSLETAYELFRVVGLVGLPDPGLERTLAVVDLKVLQEFLVLGDRVTEIAVLATHQDRTGPLRDRLADDLDRAERPLAVHAWPEVLPELEQMIILDAAGMYAIVAILIVVVGFGILNTVLMAVLERQRELGVMLALGLRPGAVLRMVFMESIVLAALGLVIGVALAVPFSLWLEAHPIELDGELATVFEMVGSDPVIALDLVASSVMKAIGIIFAVAALASVYPAIKASRANPVDALRSV
jgi:putative ABC transport system permease protein